MPQSPHLRLGLQLVAGVALFAIGLMLAEEYLPQWRVSEVPAAEEFTQGHRRIAERLGAEVDTAPVRLELDEGGDEIEAACRLLREGAADHLVFERRALLVRATQTAWWSNRAAYLSVGFGLDGRPWSIYWLPTDMRDYMTLASGPTLDRLSDRLVRSLLLPGEYLGEPEAGVVDPATLLPVGGAATATHLRVHQQASMIMAERRPGTVEDARRLPLAEALEDLLIKLPRALLSLLVLAIAAWLTMRRRIDFKNGALLAILAAVTMLVGAFPPRLGGWFMPVLFSLPILMGVYLFLLWSAGESLLRSSQPGFTTSLDTLRRGRLSRRAGRALVAGWAAGAAFAGLLLLVPVAALLIPGLWTHQAGIELPVFSESHSPIKEGVAVAGYVLLAVALARRWLPPRWAMGVAAAVSALLVSPSPLDPLPVSLVSNLLFAGLLIWTLRRHGLTAMLTASLVGFLLPPAAFAAQLPADWLGGTLGVTSALAALPLVVGLVALRRPEEAADETVVPTFLRRLESERRLSYEMDLLARMQLGLLPARLPEIEGWQVAAHSLLASEAGGDLYDFLHDREGQLWIAAGDVAGHGYSCAIAQAMTKAALVSLIDAERRPAEVLHGVDRVLRSGGAVRHFTSLTLIRLDPESGEGVIANAGYPYPMLLANGRVEEMALPGLPLGQGPDRRYRDQRFAVPPGGLLLLYSDGLFEATNHAGEAYGFVRSRQLLEARARRTAEQILEAILADWRRHLGGGSPPDDTTVVLLKRGAR